MSWTKVRSLYKPNIQIGSWCNFLENSLSPNRCEGRILSNEAVVRTAQKPGQQPVHFQEIVMLCQGIAPRLPGQAITALSVKMPLIFQLLPCTDKEAVVSARHILIRFRVVTSGKFTCHMLLLPHVQTACVPMLLYFP